ncbi:MAG: hypothetical protein ACK5P3_23400, partial [Dolichospermum sp.]
MSFDLRNLSHLELGQVLNLIELFVSKSSKFCYLHKMKPTFNNDSLSAIDLAQKSLALGSSPSEVIELIQSVTELSNVQNQQIQAKQDEERRGYLMQDI